MLQNWLLLLPEFSLLAFLPAAAVIHRYRKANTPKTFYTLAKFFLLLGLVFTVIFYNKSAFPEFWQNSPYTTLFKVTVYLLALAWFYLSSKWFLAQNRDSYAYYMLGMTALPALGLLVSAVTMILPLLLVPLLCWINRRLIKLYADSDKLRMVVRLYSFFAVLFCLLLWGGAAVLYSRTQTLDCAGLLAYFNTLPRLLPADFIAVGMIVSTLLFMLAVAPFHSWFVGAVTHAALPVSGFLTLIPPLVHLSCLIRLMTGVFGPAGEFVKIVLLIFAGFSLFIGALSANGAANLRRMFAFSSVYHYGFLLFSVLSFSDNGILSAFAYMLIYLLAMAGVYTTFLGMKSRGEYLDELDEINGLSLSKPYISASLLVFMISLIGTPPMLGFLGRLSVINNLVLEGRWLGVIVLLVSLLFMANAYLRVIRSVYFEPAQRSFDRTDKAIYICLFINLLLVLISILNPSYLLRDAEKILTGGII